VKYGQNTCREGNLGGTTEAKRPQKRQKGGGRENFVPFATLRLRKRKPLTGWRTHGKGSSEGAKGGSKATAPKGIKSHTGTPGCEGNWKKKKLVAQRIGKRGKEELVERTLISGLTIASILLALYNGEGKKMNKEGRKE